MKPEEGGGWFVLCVGSPAPGRLILDSDAVIRSCNSFDGNLRDSMHVEGFAPIEDKKGNWISFELNETAAWYSVPFPISKYVIPGTIVSFDNGCFPSIEWHFKGDTIEVFDT